MIDCTDRPARARGTSEHLLRPCTKVAPKAPTQTMGRFNAVSTVDHLFGLFKVRAFTTCLPCDLIGCEAIKRQTNNMQQNPPRIV